MITLKYNNPHGLAYITKRFDVLPDGSKLAQEDFASLAQRTPQTHGEHYKYEGNYFQGW